MCGVLGKFSGFVWLEKSVVGGLGGGEPGAELEDPLGSACPGPSSSSSHPILQNSGSQTASPASLSEMQILRLHASLIESDSQHGAQNHVFTSPHSDSDQV